MTLFSSLLSFLARHERRIGAVVFVAGFISDVLTFTLLPFSVINYFFLTYLSLAAVCTLGSHGVGEALEEAPWWRRTLSVLFPLGAQYTLGNLMSGFGVFYTKSAAVAASWPFILMLGVAYAGSEYLRKYKNYLIFQTTLFFIALYAYLIFALPLYLGTIGPLVFLGSTVAALVLFGCFLVLVRGANRARYDESRRAIIASAVTILVSITTAYFTGVIPPLPLAMKESGVYHSLAKIPSGYAVAGEGTRDWWDLRTAVVHLAPGETLYAYSAVAAPISFSSTIVHRWEQYEEGTWHTISRVSFPLSGGREGGYRGYSEQSALTPGIWRVSVETPGGQVIGRMTFQLERADHTPALVETTL